MADGFGKALRALTDFALLIGCGCGAHIAIYYEENFAKAAFWLALANLLRVEMHFAQMRARMREVERSRRERNLGPS